MEEVDFSISVFKNKEDILLILQAVLGAIVTMMMALIFTARIECDFAQDTFKIGSISAALIFATLLIMSQV